MDANAPIGLFDSGVGGLTVLSAIRAQLPHERFLYVADQAHVPYGERPLEEIERFALAITEFLFAEGAKAVVMACNISSATALLAARRRFGEDRVFGVIEPGVRAALLSSTNGKIGVLATHGTVKSGAYRRTAAHLAPEKLVIEVPCPDFVPIVESGRAETEAAKDAARRYLAPIVDRGADTVILGCTHYPFLLGALNAVAKGLTFVDPAQATAALVRASVPHGATSGADRLFTTGDPAVFARQAGAACSGLAWGDGDRLHHLVAAS